MALFVNRRSVMSLYSDATDAACHAVRFVLAEKAINVEIMDVAPDNRPEDLNALNPYDTILTLADRDLVFYEPQIIMENLDELRASHAAFRYLDPKAMMEGLSAPLHEGAQRYYEEQGWM